MKIKVWIQGPVAAHAVGSLIAGMTSQLWLIGSGIVLARLLGTTNRGYLALLILLPLVLEQLGAGGLPFAMVYFISPEPSQSRPIASQSVRWWFMQSTYLILAQSAVLILYLSHREPYLRPAAAMSLVIIPSTLAVDYSLALLQGQRKFLAFNVTRNLLPGTACIASLVAALFALREFTTVVSLLMLGYVASAVITALVAWTTVRVWPASTLLTSARDLRKFGWRALIGSAYPFEAFRFDQLIVGALFPAASLGLYVVAYAFTNLPRFLTQSLGLVAYPYIASMRSIRMQKKALVRFALLGGGTTIGVIAALEVTIAWLVPTLFGSSFVDSVLLARLLLPGALFFAVRRILAEGLKGAGHPSIGTAAEIAAWISMVPLAVVLIPTLGLPGIAVAADGAALSSLLTLLYLDRRGPRFTVRGSLPDFNEEVVSTTQ